MLILSRKSGESVCFPSIGVTVNILRASKGTTRLGIKAPAHIGVFREELLEFTGVDAADRKLSVIGQQSVAVCDDISLREELNTLRLALLHCQSQTRESSRDELIRSLGSLLEELTGCEHNSASESDSNSFTFEELPTCSALRILLIGGHRLARDGLAGHLESNGLNVQTASCLPDALPFLSAGMNQWPDVVLVDFEADTDLGLETVKRLRRADAGKKVKIVAMMASSLEKDLPEVDHSFLKPLNVDSLLKFLVEEHRFLSLNLASDEPNAVV